MWIVILNSFKKLIQIQQHLTITENIKNKSKKILHFIKKIQKNTIIIYYYVIILLLYLQFQGVSKLHNIMMYLKY